ncbi:MAG: response regulator transcription factor [Dehalococcoidales bacterium]|nr:response regulator transcription factor [Dehalococcoidales bacterium]
MDSIDILLVDDHEVVREGIRRMLELESDLNVVGEVADPEDVESQVDSLSPEIVLMDINMGKLNGIEITRRLKESHPDTNVIMLTLYDEYLTQAIEAGAVGYLLKDIKRAELVRAIRSVHQGRSPLALSLTRNQLNELTQVMEGRKRVALSEREVTILRYIAEGVKTNEIAEQLFLSQASVKRSVSLIFEKLGVRNRSEAVAEAYKRKLI